MNTCSSLYVHVPFCGEKCDYCDFFSVSLPEQNLVINYSKGIEDELAKYSHLLGGIKTVFIGGGTPTILSISQLSRLLQALTNADSMPISEFTIEANPESLTIDKIKTLSSLGINRISFGIQSFNEKIRKTIGRKGTLSNLSDKIDTLLKYNISNINFDMIYGIPGQTIKDLEQDLLELKKYPIKHLSAYSLTIEEGTPLYSRIETNKIDPDMQADMWDYIGTFLSDNMNIHRYEISNHAVTGYECRHNLDFWQGSDYLGIGPAAVSRLGLTRFQNSRSTKNWLQENHITETLSEESLHREILILGLRTMAGIDLSKLSFNPFTLCQKELEALKAQGLIEYNNSTIFPTPKGLKFADTTASTLI
ncbi:MAG: radical SAM family heme chaperone HemW [Candidatus Omnitrophica bacterium]|nr:radical SAM family heme chaperone HemW [Candidatus Omnitrophota bacterium]